MIQQNVLELALPLAANPYLEGPTESEVEYRPASLSRRLVRNARRDFEHLGAMRPWQLEPYRGFEFAALTRPSPSRLQRTRILVDSNLPDILLRRLSRRRHERLSITIGDRFEAYPTAEQHFEITRSILRILEGTRGHRIDLTTRSPSILRDLDLLGRLDTSHAVTVRVPIATLDTELADRFEPNSATPVARLEIVRTLARHGIAVVVSCGPILPGINNSADELDPLFDAVRRAGALDIIGDTALGDPKHRRRIAAWLERYFPERATRVLGQLAQRRNGVPLGTLERLRLTYGFPVHRAGRG